MEKDAAVSRAVKLNGTILCRLVLGGLHHQYGRFDLRQALAIRPLCRSGIAEQLARVALTFRREAAMLVRSFVLIAYEKYPS